jgi:hypothetical protein
VEVSSELVVEGLLDEIKRLTMEIVMLRSAMKTLEERPSINEIKESS